MNRERGKIQVDERLADRVTHLRVDILVVFFHRRTCEVELDHASHRNDPFREILCNIKNLTDESTSSADQRCSKFKLSEQFQVLRGDPWYGGRVLSLTANESWSRLGFNAQFRRAAMRF